MRLIATNRCTGTSPTVIHAQGLNQPRLSDYFNKLLTIFLHTDPPPCNCQNLTVLTVTNYHTIGSLEKSVRHLRLPDTNWMMLDGGRDFQLHHKIAIILNSLPDIHTEYILFADSHDVLVLDLDPIIDRFNKVGCEMLFNSEPFFWPTRADYSRVEVSNPRPTVMPAVFDPTLEDRLGRDHVHRYLNSGVWIARKEFLNWLLPKYLESPLNDLRFWHSGRIQSQDQIHYRHAFQQYHNKIGLDYTAELFQTLKESEIINKKREQRFAIEMIEYALRSP